MNIKLLLLKGFLRILGTTQMRNTLTIYGIQNGGYKKCGKSTTILTISKKKLNKTKTFNKQSK